MEKVYSAVENLWIKHPLFLTATFNSPSPQISNPCGVSASKQADFDKFSTGQILS